MNQRLGTDKPVFRLTFAGKMTFDVAANLEDRIVNAMRRHERIEVDLSGVTEIDLCGIHLLGLLHGVGGNEVLVVDSSPIVEQASKRLLGSFGGASLGRAARKESAVSDG